MNQGLKVVHQGIDAMRFNYYMSKPFMPYGVRGGFMVYVTIGIATWPSSPPLGLYDLFFTDLVCGIERGALY